MKGRTAKSEKMEAPKGKMPKDKMAKPVMVAGAMRSKKMYGKGGMTAGSKGTARGMGAAVKGGGFTDL